MSGEDPIVIHAPAETGYVHARLTDDFSRCVRELLGMSVWLPVKEPGGDLLVTSRGGNGLVRAYTAPRRVDDPDNALCRGFAELIRQWAYDDLGLVINPDSDTELQLPRRVFPTIMDLRARLRVEAHADLERRSRENELAEMKALAERTRNRVDGDVGGNLVQAGVIYGGVHVQGEKPAIPEVPVILTTSFGGNASVVVDGDGEPPVRFPVSGGHEVKILAEAHSAQAVILHELRAVVLTRREPRPVIDGWQVLSPLSPRRFRVDLDESPPRPDGSVSFPFTVTASDPELFVVTPTSRYEVEWRLELDWTCAGRQGSTVVPGEPFRLHPGA